MAAVQTEEEIDDTAGASRKETTDEEDSEPEFPKTLEEFGYEFFGGQELRNIETNEKFNFEAKPHDHVYNQRRYEALGEAMTQYIYETLEREKMKKVAVPVDAAPGEPVTHVYCSKNALTTDDSLIILIHGSGVVRAGQWSRRLLINDSFRSGSQIPFIRRAIGLGFGVIILNTNDNYREINGVKHKIRGSETAEKHANYVWRKIIMEMCPNVVHIGIIAHSYGGIVAVNLYKNFTAEFKDKVFGVAFTDSAHNLIAQNISVPDIKWLRKRSRNWVSSAQPLDTPLVLNNPYEVEYFSAGTQIHEQTNWMAFHSIFSYLDHRLQRKVMPLD
ncbi:cotranscriptional regulator FAM172A homolog [Uloborus diversus]|uniref:cotranscriptional regulator FAM172A homolog n=1 Tax=Uloborus diversus TaxID=327109 RepID=UPI0024093705|nr:cotranscriptional regulator FAM172A homolog [Uloborus diversus]